MTKRKPPPPITEPLYERALDLMWAAARPHAYTAAQVATEQSLTGTKVHGPDCSGCALAGSIGSFGTEGVQAPMLVIVAVGAHTVEKLQAALKEIERGA